MRNQNAKQLMSKIEQYLSKNNFKIELIRISSDSYKLQQKVDGKALTFCSSNLMEILDRVDQEGKDFLQINFSDHQKILVTESLVGFKPYPVSGLDLTRIPKVVTTPDLLSVFEALQDSLASDEAREVEIDILRKVYQSILLGAEKVGFQLDFEKRWLGRITYSKTRASA
jgi:galactitol-specific phosphotransferase system IIB component